LSDFTRDQIYQSTIGMLLCVKQHLEKYKSVDATLELLDNMTKDLKFAMKQPADGKDVVLVNNKCHVIDFNQYGGCK